MNFIELNKLSNDYVDVLQKRKHKLYLELKEVSNSVVEVDKDIDDSYIKGDLLLIKKYEKSEFEEKRFINYAISTQQYIYLERDFSSKSIDRKKYNSVKLKYTGVDRVIDRHRWILNEEIREIDYIFKNSKLPIILNKFSINIIEIVGIERVRHFTKIHFVHAYNYNSYTILLLNSNDLEKGFYQIKIKNDRIVSIIKSSERVFNNFLKVKGNKNCFEVFWKCLYRKGL